MGLFEAIEKLVDRLPELITAIVKNFKDELELHHGNTLVWINSSGDDVFCNAKI